MKIRNKIIIISTAWLLIISVLLSVTVYVLFVRIATQNEMDFLMNKGVQILEEVEGETLLQPNQNILLQQYLVNYSMIRIINIDGHATSVVTNHKKLLELDSRNVTSFETKVDIKNGQIMILARLPIRVKDEQFGTIEFIQEMVELQKNVQLLISIFTGSIIITVFVSVLGGALLSRWLLKPIKQMIHAMERNEVGVRVHKIKSRSNTNDELARLAQTYNRMMERMEENFEKHQRFISDASHELKTPITIIESYVSMLRRWGHEDEEIQHEAIEAIYEEVRRMRRLTHQMLDLASLEHDVKLEIFRISLIDVCKQLARVFGKVRKRNIYVQTRESSIIIYGDRTKVKQLIGILLDNALKYSTRDVSIILHATSDFYHVMIKDEGIGIATEDMEFIFERFYRVDQSRLRSTGGAGIGLSLAQSIAHQHGGEIIVTSELTKGSTFTVKLPKRRTGNL